MFIIMFMFMNYNNVHVYGNVHVYNNVHVFDNVHVSVDFLYDYLLNF